MVRGSVGIPLAGLIALLAAAPAFAAPPPNDDYANAAATSPVEGLPASASGTTVDATAGPGEGPEPVIWFRWRATESRRIAVWACGQGSIAWPDVYRGETLEERRQVDWTHVGSNGDCGARVARVDAGETYRISVGTEFGSGDPGPVSLYLPDEPPPLPPPGSHLSASDVAVIEGDGGQAQAVFTVTVTPRTTEPFTFVYGTHDREASSASDYVETSGSVVFEAGEASKTVSIPVNGDIVPELDERFYFQLVAPGGPSQGVPLATATIVNDDSTWPPGWLCNHLFCIVEGTGPVRMSGTDDHAELVRTLPITRRGRPRTVMEIGPNRVGPIAPQDSIEASGEVEVSVTCLASHRRCVGSRYGYDPKVSGRLLLRSSELRAGGGRGGGIALSRTRRLTCSQSLPHRNHHCVLTFPTRRSGLGDLECASCRVVLELAARHRRAGAGDKLVVGSDAPGGIAQDRGHLNAVIFGPDAPRPSVKNDRRPGPRSLPVAGRGRRSGKQRVVFSQRLGGLAAYEQILVDAKALLRTRHLPYGTFVGASVVLAKRPGSVEPAFPGAKFSEKNGFNCTRGRSAHDNPCEIRKLGSLRMRFDASRPLFVNLVVETAARFGDRWRPSDKAKVLNRGRLRVERYGPLGWVTLQVPPRSSSER